MSGELPPNVTSFGPETTCKLDTCPLEWSVYQYRPDLGANIFFAVIFSILGLFHAYLGYRWKCWGFMAGMLLGSVSEIIGYAGRIMLYNNPFSFRAFMLQIICLTIAPVFYTASIYITLSQAILSIAPNLYRWKPELFYGIFIPADVICLVLQAAGGAISTNSSGDDRSGVRISLAGLALQVVFLVFFLAAFGAYMVYFVRSRYAFSFRQKIFFCGLLISVLFILARCAFRVAELKDGYDGEIITHEIPFIIFEGVFIVVAAIALCFGHPGVASKREPAMVDS